MEKKNRRIVPLKRRPDLTEVVQLCLEALVKWEAGDSAEDLNMAMYELKDHDLNIKAIERSNAFEDSLNLLLTDGTTHRISVKRI
jgi:hypothetical protein